MTSNEAYGIVTDVNQIEAYAITSFAVGESQETNATTTIAISEMVATVQVNNGIQGIRNEEDGTNTITDHNTIVIQRNAAYDLVHS